MIPVIVVEEHHEALYAWHKFFRSSDSAEQDVALLHFDQHADMELPTSFEPIQKLMDCSASSLEHIQRNFSIDNFILASIPLQYFSSISWACRNLPTMESVLERFVATAGPDDLHLITGTHGASMQKISGSQYQTFYYQTGSIPELRPLGAKVALDIDLDYFSSERWAQPVHTRLEVPLSTYEEIQSNPLHFLRLLVGPALRLTSEEGKYFLTFHEHESSADTPLLSNHSTIESELDTFAQYLEDLSITPLIVTIARSRYSGYTPKKDWMWIEEALLKRLERLYECDIRSVDNY